jgi:hypothetical protein
MTIATGAHSTYDEPISTGGNREDLSSILKDVSPTETPLLTMMGTNTATGTNHEWLTDTLAAAASNANLEGGDMTGADPASRGREGNYTQILSKNAVVSGTQEKVLKGGGVKSEMAYQIARRMKEMKRDGEFALVGDSVAKVAGSESAARKMGSLSSYLTTNNSFAATGSSAVAGNGVDVSDYAGTNRALTPTILDGVLQSIFTNASGAEALNALVSASLKGTISGFTGSATRYVSTDDKKLVNSLDVYVGDFHTVRVVPDRFIEANLMFLIDPEYIKRSELRPMHSYDIAKLGDSTRKQIVWEWTMEVCDERAHALIADLI